MSKHLFVVIVLSFECGLKGSKVSQIFFTDISQSEASSVLKMNKFTKSSFILNDNEGDVLVSAKGW